MSKYLDINQLTDEVLASVEAAETEKTASTEETELNTEVGKAIKAAAANIREHTDELTNEDIAALVKAAYEKTAITAGNIGGAVAGGLAGGATLGPVGALGGAALGGLAGGALSNSPGETEGAAGQQNQVAQQPQQPQQQQQVQNPAAGAAKMGSATGNELRKIASHIREQGAANEEIKLTKAAKMLTAAVGLSHLTEDIK